jgi:hypothetical protein
MSRPVIYRVLPAGWVPLQVAERNLRDEASDLRYANEKTRFAHGADCSAAADDRAQVAALLEALADNLHARWLQQGEEMPEEDRLLAEASFARGTTGALAMSCPRKVSVSAGRFWASTCAMRTALLPTSLSLS